MPWLDIHIRLLHWEVHVHDSIGYPVYTKLGINWIYPHWIRSIRLLTFLEIASKYIGIVLYFPLLESFSGCMPRSSFQCDFLDVIFAFHIILHIHIAHIFRFWTVIYRLFVYSFSFRGYVFQYVPRSMIGNKIYDALLSLWKSHNPTYKRISSPPWLLTKATERSCYPSLYYVKLYKSAGSRILLKRTTSRTTTIVSQAEKIKHKLPKIAIICQLG